jgi:glycosyltransferase involved in cell wall biosynthesis
VSLDDIGETRPRTGPVRRAVRFSMLSTFPPTACGIATFAAALTEGLVANGNDVSIVRVGSSTLPVRSPVRAILDDVRTAPSARAIEELNRADVTILQHEYGLFAGLDGDAIVPVLDEITNPVIVVTHTVLRSPSKHQREVLQAVMSRVEAIVVMTEAGREVLVREFDVAPHMISVIPHGAAIHPTSVRRSGPGTSRLLTWGLLGPGKGIEWAIDAVGSLRDVRPRISYCVAGVTHPKVAATDGEAYRNMLGRRAANAGVSDAVEFDAGYRSLADLAVLISQAELVVLPYDSPDQVTSGVLVDAVAAGCPVIATSFPHSTELLASGAGTVVPPRDPAALAEAIRRTLTEPGLCASMAAEARRIAPSLAWSAVAARYASLGARLARGSEVVLT